MRFGNLTVHFVIVFLLFSFVWGAVPLPQASYGGQQPVREYELKAVYLYNFLQFVQWPDSTPTGVMVIGVLGESPFGGALEELEENVRKGGMTPIKIVHYGAYHEGMNLDDCNLLFVSASERRNYTGIIAGLKGSPVLTVSETEDFIDSGGMISLVRSRDRIRWMINRHSAESAGLRMSAQLLSIAVKVVDKP
ncbi:MAG: YfiR family protein [Nitrospirae bacterium]|nr:YfiR family protein [Nitrospirota bacterium]